jgi:hypothetical protein
MALSPNDLFTSGQILTAQECNNFGFSTVGLAASTTLNMAGVTTVVDLTGMSVTFTAIANRNYKISGYTYIVPTVTDVTAYFKIKQGATVLQTCIAKVGTATVGSTVSTFVVKTFTAGSVTLKLTGELGAGSGSLTFFADGTLPTTLLVEDIGPA